MIKTEDTFDVTNRLMQQCFEQHKDKPLFTTVITDLDKTYLAGFPNDESRQFHNCNACKRFIRNFGSLVYIDDNGHTRSPFWDIDLTQVPEEFLPSMHMLKTRMTNAAISGVFISAEAKLGLPKNWSPTHNHDWFHFNVTLPASVLHKDKIKTPGQIMALRLEEFGMLTRSLAKYTVGVLTQAEALLKSDSMMRSDKFLVPLRKFKALSEQYAGRNTRWQVVATDPTLARFGQSVVGTLLDDLAEGKSFEAAKAAFMDKIDPLQYQRAQVAPKIGNLKQAEEIVAKLGIAEALKRRVAEFSEVQGLAWVPKPVVEYRKAIGPVFANLYPATGKVERTLNGPTMTWLKFANEILPTAETIHYVVGPQAKPYCLVTTGPEPAIYKWGHNFAWYRWAAGSKPADFDLNIGEVGVRGIGTLPSMWQDLNSNFQGAILYLDNCHDLDLAKAGLGLYAEALTTELYSVRSTIEAYSRAGVLQDAVDSAAGLKITKGEPIGIRLAVVKSGVKTIYEVDRWD